MKNQFKLKKTVPLTLLDCEEHRKNDNKSRCQQIGGTICNLHYTWVACGSHLYVVDTWTGSRIAAYTFNDVNQSSSVTKIVCVEALNSVVSTTPLLAVALDCDGLFDIIAIFDIVGSRVLRSISIYYKISSICVISSGGIIDETSSVLGMLRTLDGILAVGTVGGNVIILDICQEQWKEQPHNSSISKLYIQNCTGLNLGLLENFKEESLQRNQHLALVLNDNNSTESFFTLWTPDGERAFRLDNRMKINISALHYVPQIMALMVGYNFGAWQIYNLLTMDLEFTSPIYEEIVPVSHFAYQEPSDDPREFCYIWVVYSDKQSVQPSVPLAAMYALSYDSKETLQGHGVLYQKFKSSSLRYQMDLLPTSGSAGPGGGYCVTVQSYVGAPGNQAYDASGGAEQSLALCMLIWIIWPVGKDSPETVMGLFDLDQWYKEQMPENQNLDNNDSFIGIYSISNIVPELCYPVIDVKINPVSLTLFSAVQRLEEHYYPSSLAFDFVCVSSSSFIFISNMGIQRYLLSKLESSSPNLFIYPEEMALACQAAGLVPLFNSKDLFSAISDADRINLYRECLLSLALEHGALVFLTRCAHQWASGSHASVGCTLGMFVEWAEHFADYLQQKAAELCVPLFDYSNIGLDSNARHLLDQCVLHLHNLSVIFTQILKSCNQYLNKEGNKEILDQLQALQMSSTHLDVLQWLLNVGLLPETCTNIYDDQVNVSSYMRAPYPADMIAQYYKERRKELNSYLLPTNMQTSMLFIDNLIEHECGGEKLLRQWELVSNTDNINNTKEIQLYPPRSLQAVLRTYLIDDVELHHKHSVLVYLFFDLSMSLDQSRYSSIAKHLIKFPAVFKLSSSLIKIIQAFWQLDHGDFNTAMEQLLDPMICSGQNDIRPWQHQLILKTLLVQNQHKYALLYLQVRQPPLKDLINISDMIQLLLANNLLQTAFVFQKNHCSDENTEHILQEFFTGCYNLNLVSSVIKLVLSTQEENIFVEILKELKLLNYNGKFNENFDVLYFLQHGRILEALELSTDGKKKKISELNKQGLDGKNDASIYSRLLNLSVDSIPGVMRTLFDVNKKKKIHSWSQSLRPTPLSVLVDKQETIEAQYKSNLISKSLNKVHEIWTKMHNLLQNQSLPTTARERIESTPFLCTPKKMSFSSQNSSTPVIFPKTTYHSSQCFHKSVLENSINKNASSIDNDWEESSAKRRKITNGDSVPVKYTASEKLLLTPVVKRKISKQIFHNDSNSVTYDTTLPHSILKVRPSYIKDNTTINENSHLLCMKSNDINIYEEKDEKHVAVTNKSEVIDKKTLSVSLGPTSRKSISKSLRSSVHFEEKPKSLDFYHDVQQKNLVIGTPLNSIVDENSFHKKLNTSDSIVTDETCKDLESSSLQSSDNKKQNESNSKQFSLKSDDLYINQFKPTKRISYKRKVDYSLLNESECSLDESNKNNLDESVSTLNVSNLKVNKLKNNTLQSPYTHIKGRKPLHRIALENMCEKNSSTPKTRIITRNSSENFIQKRETRYSLRSSKHFLQQIENEKANVCNPLEVNERNTADKDISNLSCITDTDNDSVKFLSNDSDVNMSFVKNNFLLNIKDSSDSYMTTSLSKDISFVNSDRQEGNHSKVLEDNKNKNLNENTIYDLNEVSSIQTDSILLESSSKKNILNDNSLVDNTNEQNENIELVQLNSYDPISHVTIEEISEDEALCLEDISEEMHVQVEFLELENTECKLHESVLESEVLLSHSGEKSNQRGSVQVLKDNESLKCNKIMNTEKMVSSNEKNEDHYNEKEYKSENINIEHQKHIEKTKSDKDNVDIEIKLSSSECDIENKTENEFIDLVSESEGTEDISKDMQTCEKLINKDILPHTEIYEINTSNSSENFCETECKNISSFDPDPMLSGGQISNKFKAEEELNVSLDNPLIYKTSTLDSENISYSNESMNFAIIEHESLLTDDESDISTHKHIINLEESLKIDNLKNKMEHENLCENKLSSETKSDKNMSCTNLDESIENHIENDTNNQKRHSQEKFCVVNENNKKLECNKYKLSTPTVSDSQEENISIKKKTLRRSSRTSEVNSDKVDQNIIKPLNENKSKRSRKASSVSNISLTSDLESPRRITRRTSSVSNYSVEKVSSENLHGLSKTENIHPSTSFQNVSSSNKNKDTELKKNVLPVKKKSSKVNLEDSKIKENISRSLKTNEQFPDEQKKDQNLIKDILNPGGKQKIDLYSSSRRLTRNQKLILESMQTELNVESDSESDDEIISTRGPDIVEMDPILLLDKNDFKGPADPEEYKHRDHSPTSSIHSSLSMKSASQPVKEVSASESPAFNTRSQKSEQADDMLCPVLTLVSRKRKYQKESLLIEQPNVVLRRSNRKSQKTSISGPELHDVNSDSTSVISTASDSSSIQNRLMKSSIDVQYSPRTRKKTAQEKSELVSPKSQSKRASILPVKSHLSSISEEDNMAIKGNPISLDSENILSTRTRSRKARSTSALLEKKHDPSQTLECMVPISEEEKTDQKHLSALATKRSVKDKESVNRWYERKVFRLSKLSSKSLND